VTALQAAATTDQAMACYQMPSNVKNILIIIYSNSNKKTSAKYIALPATLPSGLNYYIITKAIM